MPRLRFPQVKLSFLKKLLPNKFNKSRPEATSEPIIEISSKKQQDEKEEAKEPPPEECPICHDPVGVANPEGILESWVHLHCNHKFGTHCIQTWLEESAERDPHAIPSCPICRSAAKHPCGHPVVLPALRFSPFHMWGGTGAAHGIHSARGFLSASASARRPQTPPSSREASGTPPSTAAAAPRPRPGADRRRLQHLRGDGIGAREPDESNGRA